MKSLEQTIEELDVELPGCLLPLPNLAQFQGEDNELNAEQSDWQSFNYVEQYIDSELMKAFVDCTNAISLVNSSPKIVIDDIPQGKRKSGKTLNVFWSLAD